MADILQFLGVDVDPDVHLLVLLLVVNPPGQRSEGEVEADDSVVFPGQGQLHLPAVLLTGRCRNYHNVEMQSSNKYWCLSFVQITVGMWKYLIPLIFLTWGEWSRRECLSRTEQSHRCSLIDWTLLTSSPLWRRKSRSWRRGGRARDGIWRTGGGWEDWSWNWRPTPPPASHSVSSCSGWPCRSCPVWKHRSQ